MSEKVVLYKKEPDGSIGKYFFDAESVPGVVSSGTGYCLTEADALSGAGRVIVSEVTEGVEASGEGSHTLTVSGGTEDASPEADASTRKGRK